MLQKVNRNKVSKRASNKEALFFYAKEGVIKRGSLVEKNIVGILFGGIKLEVCAWITR